MKTALRSLVYCTVLLPVAAAALVNALVGRGGRVVGWWRTLRVGLLKAPTLAPGRPGGVAVAGHALLSGLLGVVALVPLSVEALWLLRGVLFGLVVPGPYDTSWGGPSRGGAWLAHFLIATPIALAGLAALAGIAALHQRLTASLDGARTPGWVVPVAGLTGLAAALLVVAWTRQL